MDGQYLGMLFLCTSKPALTISRAPESHGTNIKPASHLKLFAMLCMCCLVATLIYKGVIGRKTTIPLVFLLALAFLWIQTQHLYSSFERWRF
jgi:hypothetical protein